MSRVTDELRGHLDRMLRDPLRLAVTLAVLVLVVGFAGVLKPLKSRIDGGRDTLHATSELAEMLQDIVVLEEEAEAYRERLQVGGELVDWQDYVLQALHQADCTLVGMEKGSVKRVEDFRLVELPVIVRGDYVGLREFVDQLERGPRLLRIDHLSIEKSDGLLLRCTIRGLASATWDRIPGAEDDDA